MKQEAVFMNIGTTPSMEAKANTPSHKNEAIYQVYKFR
jgi:hypothetical protein